MKSLVLTTFAFAAFLCCAARGTKNPGYPAIDSSFERIDTTLFRENRTLRQVRLPDGRSMDGIKSEAGYSLRIYEPDYPFAVVKNFDPSGAVRQKGVSLSANACPLGIWFFFENGSAAPRIADYDAAYAFDIHRVISLLDSRGIPPPPLVPPATGMFTSVFKETDDGKAVYTVQWLKRPDAVEMLFIDGKSGAVLKVTESPYMNN